MEIYFADARGDTYRDSNKPRSAELHVKAYPLPLPRSAFGRLLPTGRKKGGGDIEKIV